MLLSCYLFSFSLPSVLYFARITCVLTGCGHGIGMDCVCIIGKSSDCMSVADVVRLSRGWRAVCACSAQGRLDPDMYNCPNFGVV